MALRLTASLAETPEATSPEATIAAGARERTKLTLLKNPVWVKIGELLNDTNPDKAKGFMNDLDKINPNDPDTKKTKELLDILEQHSGHTALHSSDMQYMFEYLESLKNLPGMDALRGIDMSSLAVAIEKHDVGKIGMPVNILNMPNIIYSPEDIRIKEIHPITGHLILRALKFDEKSVRLALTHHLRYKTQPDGSLALAGYPVQAFKDYCNETGQKPELTAEDQLAAFADVFSALTDVRRMTDRYGTHGKELSDAERCQKAFTIMDSNDKEFADHYYQKGDGAALYSAFKNAMREKMSHVVAKAA